MHIRKFDVDYKVSQESLNDVTVSQLLVIFDKFCPAVNAKKITAAWTFFKRVVHKTDRSLVDILATAKNKIF